MHKKTYEGLTLVTACIDNLISVFKEYNTIVDHMYDEMYKEMNNYTYDDLRFQIEYKINSTYPIVDKNEMLFQSMYHELYLFLIRDYNKENM